MYTILNDVNWIAICFPKGLEVKFLVILFVYLNPNILLVSHMLMLIYNTICETFMSDFELILLGDFNCRVGDFSNITNVYFCIDVDCILSERVSLGKTVNTKGRDLLKFSEEKQMLLLNGHVVGDFPAGFTHFSKGGGSTVDFCLLNWALLQ
ncbi:hypothetical protein CHUAL_014252 [Chamberlinius hualienensis]